MEWASLKFFHSGEMLALGNQVNLLHIYSLLRYMHYFATAYNEFQNIDAYCWITSGYTTNYKIGNFDGLV